MNDKNRMENKPVIKPDKNAWADWRLIFDLGSTEGEIKNDRTLIEDCLGDYIDSKIDSGNITSFKYQFSWMFIKPDPSIVYSLKIYTSNNSIIQLPPAPSAPRMIYLQDKKYHVAPGAVKESNRDVKVKKHPVVK